MCDLGGNAREDCSEASTEVQPPDLHVKDVDERGFVSPVPEGDDEQRRGFSVFASLRKRHKVRATLKSVRWSDVESQIKDFLQVQLAQKHLSQETLLDIAKIWHTCIDEGTEASIAAAANLMPTLDTTIDLTQPIENRFVEPEVIGMFNHLLMSRHIFIGKTPKEVKQLLRGLNPILSKFCALGFGPQGFFDALFRHPHAFYAHCAQGLNIPGYISSLSGQQTTEFMNNLKNLLIQLGQQDPLEPLLAKQTASLFAQIFQFLADMPRLIVFPVHIQGIVSVCIELIEAAPPPPREVSRESLGSELAGRNSVRDFLCLFPEAVKCMKGLKHF